MPFPIYHVGASGFLALTFRKWLDIPVFVLANIFVDIEVLFAKSWPHHRYWHFHTFLIGAVVGACWAITAYPMRGLFKRIMQAIQIPYTTGFRKMIVSGVLGIWLHVLLDGIYHYDVQPFWPYPKNPLWRLITRGNVKAAHLSLELTCLALFLLAFVMYAIAVVSFTRNKRKNQVLDGYTDSDNK